MLNDQIAWVDGDLIHLLLLWNYDGMQIDMESLLARDPLPSPLPEHEFITQWDCYDTPSSPLSCMLMYFHDHLAYLCETFHMLTSPPHQQGSTSVLYLELWRRLVHGAVPPFKILPHW
jgi:hypothetical protein